MAGVWPRSFSPSSFARRCIRKRSLQREPLVANFNNIICGGTNGFACRATNGTIFLRYYSSEYHDTEEDTLHILGSGSIGLFLAASLRAAMSFFPVRLLLRDHHIANTKVCQPDQHLTCITVSLKRKQVSDGPPIPAMVPVPVQLISTTNSKSPPIQNLILTTKAFQAVPALQSIRHLIDNHTQILVLCNGGLAVKEELKSVSGSLGISDTNHAIQLASITHGAHKEEQDGDDDATTSDATTLYRVVQEGVGHVYLANQSLANTLDRANMDCRVLDGADMEAHIWYKLAANCVCNPLTTLHRCTNGELSEKVKLFPSKMHDILQEVCLAHSLVSGGKKELEYGPLFAFVEKVIENNASNTTSMLQDVLHQRPTEIDYLNGYIVRVGDSAGMDFVMNRQLCLQIQRLEQQYLPLSVGRPR